MPTFVLVPGAWEGARCWERVTPELESRGHRTIAMDLPCDDPAATLETYADVVEDAVRDEDPEVARRVLFADCDEAVAQAAFDQLRPQARTPYQHPCPLEEFPPGVRTYGVCADDRLVNPQWSRQVAARRLDAEVIELPGSHSPFLSRPAELAKLLDDLA